MAVVAKHSAGGPSEVINARRTESLDAPSILKLVQPSTEQLFGRVNVVNLIEKAVLAVTLSNDQDEVLGHAAFFDYPNNPDVDPAEWEEWLHKNPGTRKCNALNTLFMHYFVAKPEYSKGCAAEIIRTVFNAVPDLHYCYLLAPNGVFPDIALSEIFMQLNYSSSSFDKTKQKSADGTGVIFCCKRHEHVPVLHIRDAQVQDHDDLVPIFNRQSDMLNNTYGDYFLAELIEAQDENMRCLVAEAEGKAIAFMSVSTDVNLNLLNECFEIGPFHGLRVPHENDDTIAPKTASPTPPEPDRPESAASNKSNASKGSAAGSQKSDPNAPAGSAHLSESKPPSRHSSAGSARPDKEDPKIKLKLSDNLGAQGSSTYLLSDQSDADSVKSEASKREPQPPAMESQAPGELEVMVPMTPMQKVPKRFVPTYYGESLSLCIQLFCIDERYEMRSTDFLVKVFELFPQHQFVVITVPHLVPEFPLLQQFVRVTPRCPSTLAQELYVFNRAGLLKTFIVRPSCTSDMDGIEKLVNALDLHENLVADVVQFNMARRDEDGTEIQAFVAECNRQVVGVAVLRREENIEYIRSHYNVEDFIYFNHHSRSEHGHLHHYALNPIFRHYSKHFLKELMRLGHKTCLYYPLFPAYADKQTLSRHSLVAALQDMVPVRARRQIHYPNTGLGGNAPSQRVLEEHPAYALNHINRKLTLEPKVTINARIVVIGASDVGIGLLETFAFCPHLRFNNLTLISPHGLPGELPPDQMRDAMLGSSQCFSHADYARMALRAWVNCVYGKMTSINRKKKYVVVNGSTLVPYDHLLICTGLQYCAPAPTEADVAGGATTNNAPKRPDQRLPGPPHPRNLFVVNDQYEAAVALYWIENNLLGENSGRVVVYSQSLDAYCCVNTLLTMGIPGARIAMVQPPLSFQTSCFNNPAVEKTVLASLNSLGVAVHTDCTLAQYNDGENVGGRTTSIKSVSFTSSTKPLRIECAAFFCYYKRIVDADAFQALNDACLVFDGRLVIDANFHTNDVAIRAAGSLTKFQRSYHADQWSHTNFNSKEVGIQLASTMLTLFDPTLEPEPEPPTDLLKLIPMYRSPKIQAAMLPGGYHYLHVCKPNLSTPLDVLMAQNDYGRELITGSVEENYFRLHINQYNSVETITCFSKQEFSMDNIICLYSLHERYLNNLLSRFDEKLVDDFYSYFQQTWALALFHDRFPDFRDEVRELLISRPSEDIEALEEKVRAMIEEDLMLSKDQRKLLNTAYTDGGFKRAVETRLLSFLTYNYYHLPMYAKPGMV